MSSAFTYKREQSPKETTKPSNIFSYKRPVAEKPQTEETKFPFEGENDLEREIERSSARTLSRMGETILGLPGDIQNLAGSLLGVENSLPTSSQLQETSEKLSKGYTKPQSEIEEKTDEVSKDIASFIVGPGSTFTKTMLRSIGIPLAGALAKEGLTATGTEEGKASQIKTGLMVALDLLNLRKGGPKKHINGLFEKAKQAIPEGAKVNVSSLEPEINAFKKSLELGGHNPKTEKALSKLNELQTKITNGHIEAAEIPAYRESINAIIENLGGFDYLTDPKIRKASIYHLGKVKDKVIKLGAEYGKTNPEFYKAWQAANEAASVNHQANKIGNFLEKTLGKKATKFIGPLFSLGTASTGLFSGGAAVATGGIGAAGTAGYQAFKVLYRVMKSPELAKYYKNIIKEASKGNAAQVISNANALEAKLKKEEGKKKERVGKILNQD